MVKKSLLIVFLALMSLTLVLSGCSSSSTKDQVKAPSNEVVSNNGTPVNQAPTNVIEESINNELITNESTVEIGSLIPGN